VRGWTRQLELQGDTLRVTDACDVAPGVEAVWQVHVPAAPVVQADGSILAGGLRITTLVPAAPSVTFVEMQTLNAAFGDTFQPGRWRIDLRSSAGCAFTVDLQAQ
jgi:hypothetical protein